MTFKSRIGLIIFLLAIITRFFYLEQIKDEILFLNPIADSGYYDYSSALIAGTTEGRNSHPESHRLPFYRLFLAIIYKIIGHSTYAAAFVQGVIGAVVSFLIYIVARIVFNEKTGAVAGIISSLYWPFIAFGAKTLPLNLVILFSILGIWAWVHFIESNKNIWVFFSGIFFACASLARSNIMLMFPVMILWFICIPFSFSEIPKKLIRIIVFLAGIFLIIIPSMHKYSSEEKQVIPLQDNYGIVMYIGADINLVNIKPGIVYRGHMRDMLDRDLISPYERNQYWLDKTKEHILGSPGRFLSNIVKKIYVLLNYYEFSPRENINYFRKRSWFLSFPLFTFGFISALSILGIIIARRNFRKNVMPLYLFAGAYFLSLMPFPPYARYRIPLAIPLIIFASFAINEIFVYARSREWGKLIPSVIVLVPLFVFTNTNLIRGYLQSFSRPLYYQGRARLRMGDSPEALEDLKIALSRHPADPDIYDAIGDAYREMGEYERAKENYEHVLKLGRSCPEVIEKIGVIYAQQGLVDRAKERFFYVLENFPTEYASTHINLGTCFDIEERYADAEEEYKRALTLSPDNIQALYKLAALYDRIHDPRGEEIRQQYMRKTADLRTPR